MFIPLSLYKERKDGDRKEQDEAILPPSLVGKGGYVCQTPCIIGGDGIVAQNITAGTVTLSALICKNYVFT
jgi:hypothetical protein